MEAETLQRFGNKKDNVGHISYVKMTRVFFEKVKTSISTDRYFHQYRKTV
jgi:hypothetical protein